MHKVSRLLSALFLLLVFAASITFSYFNTTPVSIAFGNRELPSQPVSVWIIGAFVLGGSIGLMLGLGIFRNLKSRSEIRRLNRLLQKAEQEVQQLRSSSLKDLR